LRSGKAQPPARTKSLRSIDRTLLDETQATNASSEFTLQQG